MKKVKIDEVIKHNKIINKSSKSQIKNDVKCRKNTESIKEFQKLIMVKQW